MFGSNGQMSNHDGVAGQELGAGTRAGDWCMRGGGGRGRGKAGLVVRSCHVAGFSWRG